MTMLCIVILSIIAGILYRMGGSGMGTLWRDLGVPVCMALSMFLLGHFHWTLILCFGLLFASLTTYNKWAGYLLNRPDKNTVYWESWYVTGLFYGLSMLPFAIAEGFVFVSLIRAFLLGLLVCLWSEFIGKDVWEEFGRGFLIIISLFFFL